MHPLCQRVHIIILSDKVWGVSPHILLLAEVREVLGAWWITEAEGEWGNGALLNWGPDHNHRQGSPVNKYATNLSGKASRRERQLILSHHV